MRDPLTGILPRRRCVFRRGAQRRTLCTVRRMTRWVSTRRTACMRSHRGRPHCVPRALHGVDCPALPRKAWWGTRNGWECPHPTRYAAASCRANRCVRCGSMTEPTIGSTHRSTRHGRHCRTRVPEDLQGHRRVERRASGNYVAASAPGNAAGTLRIERNRTVGHGDLTDIPVRIVGPPVAQHSKPCPSSVFYHGGGLLRSVIRNHDPVARGDASARRPSWCP